MTTHTMRLRKTPFGMIKSGEKTVECRLYDEKRQKIKLGDSIVFLLMGDDSQKIIVKVTGLLRYETFAKMFSKNNPRKFGGNDAYSLTQSLLGYYTLPEQEKYGVLGIEFEVE